MINELFLVLLIISAIILVFLDDIIDYFEQKWYKESERNDNS